MAKPIDGSRILKVGIAGFGVVGKRRRLFIDRHPNLKTVAVSDQAFASGGEFPDGVRFHPGFRELLRQEKLDALFVCLPNFLAAEVSAEGLARGLHVFCEKPPGRDLADIAKVRAAERLRPGLKLKYGFNHRYHDSVRDALRIIASGDLGKVLNMRGVYGKSKVIPFADAWRGRRECAGGGILLDQGIHMVDLMRLFAGEDFEDIHSFVSNRFWKHDVEDNAYALLRTPEGVVAMLHSSATSWRHRFQLDITLERGAITLSGILSGSKSYGAETMTVAFAAADDGGDPREQTTRYNQDNSWRDEIAEFAECVLLDRPVIEGSSAQALKTMELIYRIYCADRRWKEEHRLTDKVPELPDAPVSP